ncbi:hypothetical protein R6Q59_010421 [Mikania micrantha]
MCGPQGLDLQEQLRQSNNWWKEQQEISQRMQQQIDALLSMQKGFDLLYRPFIDEDDDKSEWISNFVWMYFDNHGDGFKSEAESEADNRLNHEVLESEADSCSSTIPARHSILPPGSSSSTLALWFIDRLPRKEKPYILNQWF